MPRVSKEMRRAIEALRTSNPRHGRELREIATETVRRFADADGAACYGLAEANGRLRPTEWVTTGTDAFRPRIEAALERLAREPVPWGTGDPRLPGLHWDRSFRCGALLSPDGDAYRRTRFHREVLAPAGIGDKIRLLVYRDNCFVAWIGALRQADDPWFDAALARHLAPLVGPVSAALRAAAARDQRVVPDGADLILRPDGGIEYLSEHAARTLPARGDVRAPLRELVRAIEQDRIEETAMTIAGMRVEWRRLEDGAASTVRYLLHLERPTPVRLAPQGVLTPAQRRVAQLASSGASARDIAEALEMRTGSVRSHLRDVYRRLHVSSRVELARVLQASPSARAAEGPSGDATG